MYDQVPSKKKKRLLSLGFLTKSTSSFAPLEIMRQSFPATKTKFRTACLVIVLVPHYDSYDSSWQLLTSLRVGTNSLAPSPYTTCFVSCDG